MPELTGRKALSHQRIVDAASRAVRRVGYHGVNVTEVMNEAQLTHGGFYAHFASRDALLSEAVAQAGVDIVRVLREQMARLQAGGASTLHALVKGALPARSAPDAAWAVTSALLGAVQLSRALAEADPAAARAVLADTRKNLLARHDA